MRTAVALLAVIVGTAAPAFAQITRCTAVSDATSRTKIILDDIVSEASLQNLMQTLTSRLNANLEQVRTELGGVQLQVMPCAGRRPTGPSDFNRTTVSELNVRGVLMEIWGATTEVKDQQGRPMNEASIGYVIIPVRLDELQQQPTPGAFVIPHRAQPSTLVDDLIKLVDQAGRLGAYASLAVGSKSLRSSQWDEARKQLCAAEAKFTRLKPTDADAALIKYAKKLAGDAVTGARADTQYTGFLKQEGVALSCS